MSDPQMSGADLARQALAAARANAKKTGNQPTKPRRVRRTARGTGRDPMPLADILGRVKDEEGWEERLSGGDITVQWATLCPQFADTVKPVGIDPETGCLALIPGTYAVASALRLFAQQLATQINTKLGRTAVRSIRVLPVAAIPGVDTVLEDQAAKPEAGPVKTRDDGCHGYQQTMGALHAHRPDHAPTDPYVVEAIARQDAALLANRQPEFEHVDGMWEQDRLERQAVDPNEATRQAAIARARADRAGRGTNPATEPRRLFPAA